MALFDTSPLTQFSKFNHFLWVCWFLGKNLSNFVSPIWKLHNPYCHSEDITFAWKNLKKCKTINAHIFCDLIFTFISFLFHSIPIPTSPKWPPCSWQKYGLPGNLWIPRTDFTFWIHVNKKSVIIHVNVNVKTWKTFQIYQTLLCCWVHHQCTQNFYNVDLHCLSDSLYKHCLLWVVFQLQKIQSNPFH